MEKFLLLLDWLGSKQDVMVSGGLSKGLGTHSRMWNSFFVGY
jgi:hypothetical protein